MSQHLLALEIFERRARYVLIESTLRNASIIAADTVDLEPRAVEGGDTLDGWSRLRTLLPTQIDSVVVNANASATSTRLLTFPFKDPRKAEAAIDFELESQVPYDLQEVARTWHLMPQAAPAVGMDVLTAIAPKAPFLERVAALSAVGLEPRAVVVPGASLLELAPHNDATNIAIVSVGEESSHLAIVRRNNLRFVRTLRAGGADVDRSLAKHFSVTLEQATHARLHEVRLHVHDYDSVKPQEQAMSRAAEEGLAPLVMALRATFKSLGRDDVPARMLLTGSLSRLPGIVEFLEARLGLSTGLIDLASCVGETMKSKVSGVGPEYGTALAMALSVFRRGRQAPLNLRQGAYAYQGDIQVYRSSLVRIAAYTAAVAFLVIVSSIVQYSAVRAEEKRIDQSFCSATQKIVGREICDPTAALATVKQAPAIGEGVVLPPFSAAVMYEVFSKSVDPGLDVVFEELDFKVGGKPGEAAQIVGKGEAASFDTTEQLIAGLQRDGCVHNPQVSKQRKKTNSDRVEFGISVDLNCPAGVQLAERLTGGRPGASPGSGPSGAPAEPAGTATQPPTSPPVVVPSDVPAPSPNDSGNAAPIGEPAGRPSPRRAP